MSQLHLRIIGLGWLEHTAPTRARSNLFERSAGEASGDRMVRSSRVKRRDRFIGVASGKVDDVVAMLGVAGGVRALALLGVVDCSARKRGQ